MQTAIATLKQGTNGWYSVPTASLSEELLQYFTDKAGRTPKFCRFTEDAVEWQTQFEWADRLGLEAAISEKTGNLFLKTTPILTQAERKEMVLEKQAKFRKPEVAKPAVNSIDITGADL